MSVTPSSVRPASADGWRDTLYHYEVREHAPRVRNLEKLDKEEEMQDNDVQEKSLDALFNWANYLRDRLQDSCFQRNGNIIFDALVSYCYAGEELVGSATVRVTRNGFDDGKVNILGSEQFDAGKIHTEYHHAWQKYSFNEATGAFIVTGRSHKYGYEYRVAIFAQLASEDETN